MLTQYCPCGARYRFPGSALGKRAKCRKCGAVFKLTGASEATIPLADEDPVPGVGAGAERPLVTPSPHRSSPAAGPPPPDTAPTWEAVSAAAPPADHTYAGDVLWTFLFPASPHNLLTFLAIWGVMALGPHVPCLGPIIGIFLGLWFAAFQFEVICTGAAGEADLPDPLVSNDFLTGLIVPVFKWIGSWLVVLLPAGVYLLVASRLGAFQGFDVFALATGGLSAFLTASSGAEGLFIVLVILGLLAWPMVVLCISLGGFTTLYRLDLIVLTIVRTFPVYLLTLALMFVAVFGHQALVAAIGLKIPAPVPGSPGPGIGAAFLYGAAFRGLDIYFSIVLMRLIGLYYFHFKDRFAWSWE